MIISKLERNIQMEAIKKRKIEIGDTVGWNETGHYDKKTKIGLLVGPCKVTSTIWQFAMIEFPNMLGTHLHERLVPKKELVLLET